MKVGLTMKQFKSNIMYYRRLFSNVFYQMISNTYVVQSYIICLTFGIAFSVIKAYMNSDVPLETTAIFFSIEPLSKQGIG